MGATYKRAPFGRDSLEMTGAAVSVSPFSFAGAGVSCDCTVGVKQSRNSSKGVHKTKRVKGSPSVCGQTEQSCAAGRMLTVIKITGQGEKGVAGSTDETRRFRSKSLCSCHTAPYATAPAASF